MGIKFIVELLLLCTDQAGYTRNVFVWIGFGSLIFVLFCNLFIIIFRLFLLAGEEWKWEPREEYNARAQNNYTIVNMAPQARPSRADSATRNAFEEEEEKCSELDVDSTPEPRG